MLVQQFGGAFLALLVAGAFGFAAAKACTIGLGLFRRPIPFRALLELFQIDGFPHDHFHHPNGWYRGTIPGPRTFSRMALVTSVFIMKKSPSLKKLRITFRAAKAAYFCALTRRNTIT